MTFSLVTESQIVKECLGDAEAKCETIVDKHVGGTSDSTQKMYKLLCQQSQRTFNGYDFVTEDALITEEVGNGNLNDPAANAEAMDVLRDTAAFSIAQSYEFKTELDEFCNTESLNQIACLNDSRNAHQNFYNCHAQAVVPIHRFLQDNGNYDAADTNAATHTAEHDAMVYTLAFFYVAKKAAPLVIKAFNWLKDALSNESEENEQNAHAFKM